MTAKLLLILLLLTLALSQNLGSSPGAANLELLPPVLNCVAYQAGNCVTCPYNYHINQNQCYLNITGCIQYSITSTGAQTCTQCDPKMGSPNNQGGCSIVQQMVSNQAQSAGAVASSFGDNRFRIVSEQAARSTPYFQMVNKFMLNGQYKHFIARTAQPVVSVAFFSTGDQNQYKILYNGSGGGLMMCIITVWKSTNAIQINSFVPIGVTNVIANCGQYDLQMKCLECVLGWHLQGGKCFVNIDGCVSYREHICVLCNGFAILVENRCVSCTGMSDLNKMVYYGNVRRWINNNNVPLLSQSYLLG